MKPLQNTAVFMNDFQSVRHNCSLGTINNMHLQEILAVTVVTLLDRKSAQ